MIFLNVDSAKIFGWIWKENQFLDPNAWSGRGKCNSCGSEMEVTLEDLKEKQKRSLPHDFKPGSVCYWLECPLCGREFLVVLPKQIADLKLEIEYYQPFCGD
jgi:hypothetical protein